MVGHNFLSTAQVMALATQLPDNVILTLVVGPHDNISVSNLQSCTNVEILEGKTELFSQLKDVSLYIGAAGGIILSAPRTQYSHVYPSLYRTTKRQSYPTLRI